MFTYKYLFAYRYLFTYRYSGLFTYKYSGLFTYRYIGLFNYWYSYLFTYRNRGYSSWVSVSTSRSRCWCAKRFSGFAGLTEI